MTETLVLLHTVAPLVAAFAGWCDELLPGVSVLHVLDEPLIERIRRRGTTATADEDRLAEHVAVAESVGANAVLVTCSTVSLCVDAIRPRFRVPVLKIDEAMAAEAVRRGPRICVVATAATTLEPSRALLTAESVRVGRPVEIATRLVEAALPALLGGDASLHDRLVEDVLREEAERCDVVVLAQASTARVLDSMAGRPVAVPVLSSPRLALEQVRQVLSSGESPADAPPIASGVRP